MPQPIFKTTRYATTEYNRRERILGRIKAAYADVQHFRLTDAELQRRRGDIYRSADAKRLTRADLGYVHGYDAALREALWRVVQFHYVTERGLVGVAGIGANGGHLTGEECRRADGYPRGFTWPHESGRDTAWFIGPAIGS